MWKQDRKRQRLRERSRSLFGGAQYRLEVGAAIADGDGIVCIKDLAELLGDPPGTGSTNTELKVLERFGLLTRAAKKRGERRVYLLRGESGYWEFCQEARDSAFGSPQSPVRATKGQLPGNMTYRDRPNTGVANGD